MRWILIVMISLQLLLCEVKAIRNLNSSQCRRNMFNNWHDKTYRPYRLQDVERSYLASSEMGERADAPPGVRQECRTLSDAKRNLLFRAIQSLFNRRTGQNGMSIYDLFRSRHRFSEAPPAHFGPCFPPWHREFLLRFEQALQEFNPTVNLCYWDTELDVGLPDASHSCLWTAEYFGECEGFVRTGFAANLAAFPTDCGNTWPSLYRSCGGNNLLYTRDKVNALYRATTYSQLVSPYTSNMFENFHGEPHGFVGGHMGQISCAAGDPIFYFHHTYIDMLWENCRRRQRTNREQEYPTDGQVPAFHRANDPMRPFSKTCLEGLSNSYIPGIYSYEPSPSTISCSSHAECGGKALWCNRGRCTSCVGPNGRMGVGWPDEACLITGCPTPRNINQVCRCAQ